ncbi:MAG: DUF3502 domain-containing protein [Oscillospiraceae bacterium]|nr:DUF3502 domain-containing protein [Oscillospiraceae bacterium]
MKKIKALLALVLAIVLCLGLFAACAKTETPAKTDEPAKTDAAPASTDTAPAKTDTAPAKTEDKQDDEQPATEETDPIKARLGDDWEYDVETLVFYILDDSGKNADYADKIQDAMNEYLEPYGINVELRWGQYGSYPTNVSMDVYSGQHVDLAMMYPGRDGNFLNWYTDSMLMEIGDYLNEYAPELMELMDRYMGAVTYEGGIYGVPTMRILSSNPYFIFRKDILEQVNMVEAAENCKSWSDMEKILVAIKEGDSGVYPTNGIVGQGGFYTGDYDNWSDGKLAENLDNLALTHTEDDKVVLLPEWEYAVGMYKRAAEWKEKGYIYPDAIFTEALPDELLSAGVVASYLAQSEYGVEATKKANLGFDVVAVMPKEGFVSGGSLRRFGWVMPSTCEYPEKAALILNFMYTDPYFNNLMAWGIEGEDWVEKNGEACYPDDMSKATYHNRDFIVGNQFLVLPWDGNGADFREKSQAVNDAAPVSEYSTFSFVYAGFEDLVTGLSAVNDIYNKQISGGFYTEELYNSYISELKKAGADDYIAEVQRQVDAWRAEQ